MAEKRPQEGLSSDWVLVDKVKKQESEEMVYTSLKFGQKLCPKEDYFRLGACVKTNDTSLNTCAAGGKSTVEAIPKLKAEKSEECLLIEVENTGNGNSQHDSKVSKIKRVPIMSPGIGARRRALRAVLAMLRKEQMKNTDTTTQAESTNSNKPDADWEIECAQEPIDEVLADDEGGLSST